MDRKRQVAVITGANRGLGLETCRQLVQQGLRVVLTSRNRAEGQSAADQLCAEGLPVLYQPLDVTNPTSAATLAATLSERFGTIDVLINNAGIALDGFNSEVARRTLAVNCLGAMTVFDQLRPVLAPSANLVMVSSGMGQLAGLSASLRVRFLDPALTRASLVALLNDFVEAVEARQCLERGWPDNAYRISKAGLNAFTRILAMELAPTGIRVNAVCPGWVRTAMGGPLATRSVEEGARSIVWAALLKRGDPTGGFFRDGRPIPW